MKKRILAALAAIGLAVGLSVTAAAPAQAFTTFRYTADCPGNARYQQLVIRNYSGSGFQVESRTIFQSEFHVTIYPQPSYTGAITYVPIEWTDNVTYRFAGAGSLEWFYHVDCFY